MTKSEFLNILADGLKDFPQKELSDILFDYQEHFTSGFQSGKTEDEIIEELGSPYDIVHQYRSSYIEKVDIINAQTNDDIKDKINDVNFEDVTEDFEEPAPEEEDYSYTKSDDFTDKFKTGVNNAVNKASQMSISRLLIGIIIALFLAPVFFAIGVAAISVPFGLVVGVIGCIIAIFCVAFLDVSFALFGFTVIPPFISDFPVSSIVFLLLGLTLLLILFTMLAYYIAKKIFILIKAFYKKLIKGDK